MKKIIVSLAAGLAIAVGGAGLASAQTDPVISVDNEEVEPNGEVTINVEGAEPEAEIEVELGDATSTAVAAEDGTSQIRLNVGDAAPGQLDGIVTINGVEYPISVVIAALQEEGGDGTPAPTAVNTGDELAASSSSTVLFAAAAGLFLLGGGAVALRQRSAQHR